MVEASAQTNAWIKFLMHTAECVFTGHHWSRGATDNASDYGSEDCRFESCRDRFLFGRRKKMEGKRI